MNRKYRRFPFSDDFDELFGLDINRIIDEMNSFIQDAQNNPEHDSGKPLYYGYSVQVGPDGKPQIREWGNVKPDQPRIGRKVNPEFPDEASCKSCREPDVGSIPPSGVEEEEEVYSCSMFDDKKNELKIHADIPGVKKEEVDLQLKSDKLILSAKNESRCYHKEIPLDFEVTSKEIKANYNNGVLEITLKCKKKEEEKGERIDID